MSASLRNAEARRAGETSPLFQQREKVQENEESPRRGRLKSFLHGIF
jgi:hypothetical protein